jgi:hypothetical protein
LFGCGSGSVRSRSRVAAATPGNNLDPGDLGQLGHGECLPCHARRVLDKVGGCPTPGDVDSFEQGGRHQHAVVDPLQGVPAKTGPVTTKTSLASPAKRRSDDSMPSHRQRFEPGFCDTMLAREKLSTMEVAVPMSPAGAMWPRSKPERA